MAVKPADPTIVHKTARGLVRTGLTSVDDVRTAVEDFVSETGDPDLEVLVQPLAHGIEVALGVIRDPGLGPMVMVAAGGTAAEVWDDRSLLLAPVSAQDAARALRSLRIWPLLSGYRGSEPVDEQALVDADRGPRPAGGRRTRARRGRSPRHPHTRLAAAGRRARRGARLRRGRLGSGSPSPR